MYRWLPAGAHYDPDSPWWTSARFGNGTYKTLYVAASARGALAEYLRRFPEFFDLQDQLRISLTVLDLDVVGACADMRTEACAAEAGIAFKRLTSSDADESLRYVECRDLGERIERAGHAGIAYPAAGAAWLDWNLVLLGEQHPDNWICLSWEPEALPAPLARAEVRVLA